MVLPLTLEVGDRRGIWRARGAGCHPSRGDRRESCRRAGRDLPLGRETEVGRSYFNGQAYVSFMGMLLDLRYPRRRGKQIVISTLPPQIYRANQDLLSCLRRSAVSHSKTVQTNPPPPQHSSPPSALPDAANSTLSAAGNSPHPVRSMMSGQSTSPLSASQHHISLYTRHLPAVAYFVAVPS